MRDGFLMSNSLTGFVLQIAYLFKTLSISNLIDIASVAVVFFLIFQVLHRTRTMQLLRGAIIAAILGVAFLVLLPLNTFGWLIQVVLLAGLISLPILFQDELRKLLTSLGQLGRRRYVGSDFEDYKAAILSSVKNLASRRHGALIVLEGQTLLEDIIVTGIQVGAGPVTGELLQTIFFPNTPLHDGAVILRGNQIVAASCILPVETEKTKETHLGTRHRAALGLSKKVPDAMTIVVSEETSRVSVAQAGQIYLGLTQDELAARLDRFNEQITGKKVDRWGWFKGVGLRETLINVVMALILATVAWLSVTYQTNPPQQVLIEDVPLTVIGPGQDILVMSQIPDSVDVQIQTTRDRLDILNAENVNAEIDLSRLELGEHRVDVQVILPDRRSQALWVKPTSLTLVLEPEITREMIPTIRFEDINSLPIGYSVSEVTMMPSLVAITGAAAIVESVEDVILKVQINNRRSDFQESITPTILSNSGEEITGLKTTPNSVIVDVPVKRNFFTKEISVRANVDNSKLEEGYEIRSIRILPSVVTLSGAQGALEAAGEYLNTTPVDLTGVYDNLAVSVPLMKPEGVTILDENGDQILNVQVVVDISPVTGYLVLQKPIGVRNIPNGMTPQLSYQDVSVLLIGPKPLLDQIKANQELIQVYLDLEGLLPNVYSLPLEFESPQDLEIMVFPGEVRLVLEG